MTIRTRFAPSPTGFMHVGNLRTALYEYLVAKHAGGTFVLRIEDTDRERYVEGATQVIYDTMAIAGLKHDEGPDIGGDFGPYVQSERLAMYKPYAEQLIKEGKAYRCFCTKERLESLRENAADGVGGYDRHCRDLSEEEIEANLKAGIPYVIRQKMPLDGETSYHDYVYGDITFPNKDLDDQILIKTDGFPTYNFANVIDDHTMGITHVVRGSEYLSSTPKYNLLYEAFGWDIPEYVHCAPVMYNDPATGEVRKMSKRCGDPSYEDLIAQGYLTDAVINYVALLGWSPGGEREIYSLDELKEIFDLKGISKSPAIFDLEKLKYFNAEYIRSMSPEKFAEIAEPFIRQAVKNPAIDPAAIAALLQQRTEILTDIPEKLDFFDVLAEYDASLFVHQKSKSTPESAKAVLTDILPMLEELPEWKDEGILAAMTELTERMGVKKSVVMWPVRIAAAGKAVTPGGAVEICRILGREETLRRLRIGLEKLA